MISSVKCRPRHNAARLQTIELHANRSSAAICNTAVAAWRSPLLLSVDDCRRLSRLLSPVDLSSVMRPKRDFSAQICLRCDLGLAGNRRQHPDWNFESLARRIENGDRAIATPWSSENPQSIAVKRMKRIKNLDVCDVRTQGIVRDDGLIHTFIVWFLPAAGLPAISSMLQLLWPDACLVTT
jgi:hypothetical protein